MRNQSIFNSWVPTPNFSTKKHNFSSKKSPFLYSMLRVKSFMLAPKKKDGKSRVNYLKYNIGIIDEGKYTFKTDFISVKPIIYNGHYLSLKVNNDVVELFITDGVLSGSINAWDINLLVKKLLVKNSNCNFINRNNIVKLINSGKMVVKFNVSKIKDHGTTWKVIK